MWCAPRSVSCLCSQWFHYLRRDRKSQFPTQHFPWEHGTKILPVRGIFFADMCKRRPAACAHAHTCPACAHRREDGAFFRLRRAAAQRPDAHEERMHILTFLLNPKRYAYIFPLKLIYDKNVL